MTIKLKSLVILLGCIALVRLFRHLVMAPYFSLASIGTARHVLGRTPDPDGPEDALLADAVQNKLFQAHNAWITADIVLDVAVLTFLIVALIFFARRKPDSRGG